MVKSAFTQNILNISTKVSSKFCRNRESCRTVPWSLYWNGGRKIGKMFSEFHGYV